MPVEFGLKGKDAKEQFLALARTLRYSLFDFSCEVAANHPAIFLGFFFWEQWDFTTNGFETAARDEVLEAIQKRWATSDHASIRLGVLRAV